MERAHLAMLPFRQLLHHVPQEDPARAAVHTGKLLHGWQGELELANRQAAPPSSASASFRLKGTQKPAGNVWETGGACPTINLWPFCSCFKPWIGCLDVPSTLFLLILKNVLGPFCKFKRIVESIEELLLCHMVNMTTMSVLSWLQTEVSIQGGFLVEDMNSFKTVWQRNKKSSVNDPCKNLCWTLVH